MFVLHVYLLSCVYLLLVCYAHDFPCTCTASITYLHVHVHVIIVRKRYILYMTPLCPPSFLADKAYREIKAVKCSQSIIVSGKWTNTASHDVTRDSELHHVTSQVRVVPGRLSRLSLFCATSLSPMELELV